MNKKNIYCNYNRYSEISNELRNSHKIYWIYVNNEWKEKKYNYGIG